MGSETGSRREESKSENGDNYWAYDLYPERKERARDSFKFFERAGNLKRTDKTKCEMRAYESLTKHPMVRILLNALESAGCPFDVKRNISCEVCDARVTGGYDQETNQIVLCQNSSKTQRMPETSIIHELVHMFDYCVNDVDFKNHEHLACTEIRAANLTHCSFMSSFLLAQSSLWNIKQTHQYCVKMKATQSLMVSRNMDFETALSYVIKVFDKCYNDLEPIGRRIRRNSCEGELAFKESIPYRLSRPPQ